MTPLEWLDEHLQRSEYDSQDWADGLGAELAAERLAELSQDEWASLQRLVSSRSENWRACLAEVLRPQLGEIAATLLIDLSADPDIEVAFSALRNVALYCGVNDSAQGPFLDPRTLVPAFLQAAKKADGLIGRIQTVSAQCHPRFQQQFGLLTNVLTPAS